MSSSFSEAKHDLSVPGIGFSEIRASSSTPQKFGALFFPGTGGLELGVSRPKSSIYPIYPTETCRLQELQGAASRYILQGPLTSLYGVYLGIYGVHLVDPYLLFGIRTHVN